MDAPYLIYATYAAIFSLPDKGKLYWAHPYGFSPLRSTLLHLHIQVYTIMFTLSREKLIECR